MKTPWIRRWAWIAALPCAALASAQDPQPLMGEPMPGLTPTELNLFFQGQFAFAQPLTISEGVGPIFNEVSCASCHNVPAIGGFSTRRVTRFGVAAAGGNPFDDLANLGGSLLQDQSLDLNCRELVPAQANVVAQRATPHVFGAGLLEAIPDADIITNAALQNPAIQGQVSMVSPLEGGANKPARFGWKGGIATVHSFSIDAALNEMGLTTPFLPNENAPNGDMAALASCDTVSDPEDAPDGDGFLRIDRFTHFQRFLAPPAQTPQSGMTGEAIFASIGCAACHTPSYTTGTVAEAALSNQIVRPYSDFLLHDMGALGDQIVEGNAGENWMMTRALWGLAQRTSLLHDGRATGANFDGLIDQAVAEHGGQGASSRAAYQALSATDRDLVIDFLLSLGRTEFDWDIDNQITEFDWFFLEPLMTGPSPFQALTPDAPGGDL